MNASSRFIYLCFKVGHDSNRVMMVNPLHSDMPDCMTVNEETWH